MCRCWQAAGQDFILVPEIGVGFEVNLVGNFWLTYQFIHRGSEFERRTADRTAAHLCGFFIGEPLSGYE